eukprot:TRINITY_DN95568_c0_g1_i1.p1 TRINITY_DN95568_c0_g1~~TRINITY_DN95568_c0_g1_i1.p1  ORF type:complete len:196 (+),score=13.97 TRINITY_DN95568_c0_g1_i1:106-693(+)
MALRLTPPLLPAAALHGFRQGGANTRSPQSSPGDKVMRRSPEQKKQAPLLPAAALYRPKKAFLSEPTPRVSTNTLKFSPTGPRIQASPGSVHGSRNSPAPSPSPEGLILQGRASMTPSPNALLLLRSPASCSRKRGRTVWFNTARNTVHEITPYEDFYGTHPDYFDFDAEGNMVGWSPVGCVDAADSFEPLGLDF